MVFVYFIYNLYLIVSPILGSDEKGQLVFVYTHFRHGARGPAYNLTVDGIDYFGFNWKNPQDLTAVGMRMHYTLGIRNRKRYQGLLSKTFDPREVIVKSTNFNRTINTIEHKFLLHTTVNLSGCEGVMPIREENRNSK